jgi:hypothetical protein
MEDRPLLLQATDELYDLNLSEIDTHSLKGGKGGVHNAQSTSKEPVNAACPGSPPYTYRLTLKEKYISTNENFS